MVIERTLKRKIVAYPQMYGGVEFISSLRLTMCLWHISTCWNLLVDLLGFGVYAEV